MNEQEMRERTKLFGLAVIKMVEALPYSTVAGVVGKQLLRSATSVGANYRSACRARSKADFIAKMAIAQEESDESEYWLELLSASGHLTEEQCVKLRREAGELTRILAASCITAKRSLHV